MTFVIAKKFDDHIVVLADTMIAQPEKLKHDIIPGQLKTIVINLRLTVAFSGHVVTALDLIRKCKSMFDAGGTVDGVIDLLASTIACDFLVVSHFADGDIIKIVDGIISEPQTVHWIGNHELLNKMEKRWKLIDEGRQNVRHMNPDMPDLRSDESDLTTAFGQTLVLDGPQVVNNVGGFATHLIASRRGHYYQQHASAYMPGPINIGGPPPPDSLVPGGDRYSYNFLESGYAGVGIAGVFMEEAKTGYIYDPLRKDCALKIENTSMKAVMEELERRGLEAGGKHYKDL